MNFYQNIFFIKIYNFFINQKLLLRRRLNLLFGSFTSKTSFFFFIKYFEFFCYNNKNSEYPSSFSRKSHFAFMQIFHNNFIFFYIANKHFSIFYYIINFFFIFFTNFNYFFSILIILTKRLFGDGFFYIRGLLIIFFIDASITDDEPLWEPLEWSLVQTWIFFIFIFAWIAENLITSRYGSYTGRDKRVWFAWYKSFWLLESWYAISYGLAALFVIVPFYYELTYTVSFVFSWWNWYNRIFFFKFVSLYAIILLMSYFFQLNLRWFNWKKTLLLILLINFFIGYLLYTNFIISFFGYFTDPLWYQKTRFIDYIQLSHEPLKWGWGPSKRDHFTYHKVSTVFWFKNDGPFAGAFLMIHLFFFLSLFFLYLYWITLLRRIYTTKEITYTFSTYCVSSFRQFFYFFFLFYVLIIVSFLINYWRFPIEFLWIINSTSWFLNFSNILLDYCFFLICLI